MLTERDRQRIGGAYSSKCNYPLEQLFLAAEETLSAFDRAYRERTLEVSVSDLPHPHDVVALRASFIGRFELIACGGSQESSHESGQSEGWMDKAANSAFAVGLGYLHNPTPDVKGGAKASVNTHGLG